MPTDKQRREAARRHLERQLKRRADRDASRKRVTLILSIVGTLVVIAAVIVAVSVIGSDDNNTQAGSSPSASTVPTDSATAPASTGPALPPTPAPTSYGAAKGASVTFQGVTVTGATDLTGKPGVTATGKTDPAKLTYKDLVVGKGKAADAATSTVRVQYVGVLYEGGKTPFDNSWDRGQPTDFSLAEVVPGFTQGIGGGEGVPPMKVGGRRLIIMPSAMGYGAQSPDASIPANSPLVFVVDLVATT